MRSLLISNALVVFLNLLGPIKVIIAYLRAVPVSAPDVSPSLRFLSLCGGACRMASVSEFMVTRYGASLLHCEGVIVSGACASLFLFKLA